MTKQPIWKTVANLGDVTPIDYGGYFVKVDTTGVYCAEGELLVVPEDNGKYEVYRFTLDRCTFMDGVLSDNKYHPSLSAWFADKEGPRRISRLYTLADANSIEAYELIKMFCSEDPIQRAHAYRMVGDYYGYENLDSYPLHLTETEVKKRYKKGY